MNLTDVINRASHAKRWRIKNYVNVAPKYARDAKGRFTGGYERKGYVRKVYDKKAPMVTNMQLMAENVAANNALLKRLMAA